VAARKTMIDIPAPVGQFDLRTHYWDNNGNLMKTDHYTKYCQGITDSQGRLTGESETYYERPQKSGNLWHENGEPAGRVEYRNGKRHFNLGAPHIAYTPELPGDPALAARVAELEAELAQINKERSPAPAGKARGG